MREPRREKQSSGGEREEGAVRSTCTSRAIVSKPRCLSVKESRMFKVIGTGGLLYQKPNTVERTRCVLAGSSASWRKAVLVDCTPSQA